MAHTKIKIGKFIKKEREAQKLTQETLAKRVRVSKSYLSDLETDRRTPSLQLLIQLADTLRVTLECLTGRGL